MDYDELQFMSTGGYQRSDDEHPAGTGLPGI